jgi:putative redox protein
MKLALDWVENQHFRSSAGFPSIELKSSAPEAASPPQALAYAVMGCMGMDVVHVLTKGRHALRSLKVSCDAERASEHPRRFIRLALHFDVATDAPDHVVARAIELSSTKYCSVWHSLRSDIAFATSYTVHGIGSGP